MTDRRRVWITGIGIVTRDRDRRDAFWAGLRARPLARSDGSTASIRPVPVAGRGPDR